MRRLRDPEIRERLRELDEQRAQVQREEDQARIAETYHNGGPVLGSKVGHLVGEGVVINPETEEVIWSPQGEPYVVNKAKAVETAWHDAPELSRWPWQRCKVKDWASAGTHGYALRCDRKKRHTGKHYVERAFQSYWFE